MIELKGKIVDFVEGFEEAGYSQKLTRDGQKAIEELTAQEPDVCFLAYPGIKDGRKGYKIVRFGREQDIL